MKLSKLSLAVLAAVSLISLAPTTRAEDPPPQTPKAPPDLRRGGSPRLTAEERVKMYTEKLKLSDEQHTKVKTLVEENLNALRDLPSAERPEKGPALEEEFVKKMKAILSAEQFKQFEEIQKNMRPTARRNPAGTSPTAPDDNAAKQKKAE